MKWGHDQLANDLAQHLRGNSDRIVWTDMQLGPSGSPRPDVYTVPKSYSAFKPIAYECKISVSDFRRDVTSGKWQNYLKFAAGVIFAVPAGLIKKEDIPAGCGLIVRHEEIWRTLKGPTLRAIDTLPHDAWMKLMIDGLNRQNRDPQPRLLNTWSIEQVVRKKYGDTIGQALSDLNQAERWLANERLKAEVSAGVLRTMEEERIKHQRANVERELDTMRSSKLEFCQMLGLPPDASSYLMQRTVSDIRDRLEGDGEIQRMRKALDSAQRALADGLKPMPTLIVEPTPDAEAA